MKTGWRMVAKLGTKAPHFPHILSDAHGWAIRLGPNAYADMKHYSSFPNVLAGLVEHLVRRRLGAETSIVSIQGLIEEARKEFDRARELCHGATREIEFVARQARKEAI